MAQHSETRLIAAREADLRVTDAGWDFARRHAPEIAAHWARRSAENPHYFNGIVLMMSDYSLSGDGHFAARFVKTDFRSFLYWRETGQADPAVRDTVATALIRARDGSVLLCQQRPGHLNTGFTTPPGGFLDARDVREDGTVDIAHAVMREIGEETGLGPPTLRQGTGFLIAIVGRLVSIAVPWESDLTGAELADAATRHIATDPEGELARVFAVAPAEALETLTMPDYARHLLGAHPLLKTSA